MTCVVLDLPRAAVLVEFVAFNRLTAIFPNVLVVLPKFMYMRIPGRCASLYSIYVDCENGKAADVGSTVSKSCIYRIIYYFIAAKNRDWLEIVPFSIFFVCYLCACHPGLDPGSSGLLHCVRNDGVVLPEDIRV